MTDFQIEKQLIKSYYAALDECAVGSIETVLNQFTSSDYLWRGFFPFHEQTGSLAVSQVFWKPLRKSMSGFQRRMDVFMAGVDSLHEDGAIWVTSMGHLMGLFDAKWLGISPNGKIAMLRYAEFHRVENGKIAETAQFCDLIHLMHQAGLQPLPPQTGAHLVQPGPRTHDGLLRDKQNPATGAATLDLINRMIGDIAANSNGGLGSVPRDATPQEELQRCWSDQMIWWGPDGIGATYTIDRYVAQHQRPFRTQLSNRKFHGHIARFAEGNYGGFFGWSNLSVTPEGGYLGLPATGKSAEMRVVDIYRREGDKLAENWVFIDILFFLKQQGLDVLERMAAMTPKA